MPRPWLQSAPVTRAPACKHYAASSPWPPMQMPQRQACLQARRQQQQRHTARLCTLCLSLGLVLPLLPQRQQTVVSPAHAAPLPLPQTPHREAAHRWPCRPCGRADCALCCCRRAVGSKGKPLVLLICIIAQRVRPCSQFCCGRSSGPDVCSVLCSAKPQCRPCSQQPRHVIWRCRCCSCRISRRSKQAWLSSVLACSVSIPAQAAHARAIHLQRQRSKCWLRRLRFKRRCCSCGWR